MTAVAELAALREANCRLRDKLLEIAKGCPECGGTGIINFGKPPIIDDCPACLDIREILRC